MHFESAPPASSPPIDPASIHRDALRIVHRLSDAGFKAYLVGGCVRDLLLDLHPKDFDISTDATPRQIKRLFRHSRIIGRRFRLAHVRFGPRVFEVSTFRAPPQALDGDDPYILRDNIFGTEEQDAFRRDFTINALFYDPEAERVVDHVGGLSDLEARRLRTIGEAETRLREDPVRILRAARFVGRLGFELTDELRAAAARHAQDLSKSAPPRVLEELYRLLASRGSPKAVRVLEETGALAVLLPEVVPLPDVFYPALERLDTYCEGDRSRVSHALMVAVLLSPAAWPLLLREGEHDYEALVGDMLRPIALRLTLARRDATGARQALAAQARLAEDPRGRSAHRFVRRDFFHDALLLRRFLGPLGPGESDPLPHWEQLAHEAPPQGEPSPPRRRRRRRRRRRGGRGGPPDTRGGEGPA